MKLYPEFLQKLILPLADKLLGVNFNGTMQEWKQLEKRTPAELREIQAKKLKAILTHARETVPFYKALPGLHSLGDFPIATKALYSSDEKAFLSDRFDRKNLLVEKSSGSSGIQGKVYITRKEAYQSMAHQTFLWSWAGYEPGLPLFQLGMTTKRSGLKKGKDVLFQTDYQQAFNLNKKEVVANLRRLSQKKRTYFFGGYASGLYEYARIAKEEKINDLTFKAVISWGDKMFSHYRDLLENQFNCEVFDTYGTTEGFQIAGECEYHRFHILSPHVYLEILDDNGNEVNPGEWGHVVLSRLDGYSMPLIRYRIGDLAMKADPNERCNCGRPFPLLSKVIGRDTDVIKTPSGKTLIVHFFTGILEHLQEIQQFQVVQHRPEDFELRFIRRSEDAPLEELIGKMQQALNEKAGEKLVVRFQEVRHIANSPSGKPQIIVSHLEKANLS